MRKILSLFVTFLLVLTLVACTKETVKTNAELKIINFENNGTSVTFNLELKDPEDEITGDIRIFIKDNEDFERNQTTTKDELILDDEEDELKNFSFGGLTLNKRYEIEVSSTISEKAVVLATKSFTARAPHEINVETVEDFFTIKDNRNAKVTLMNDLDFADYHDEINDNLIGTFTGTFNGNGKTIKNYKISSSNINQGLFQQLSTNAEVYDLNIDNMVIDHKGDVTGTKRVGFLFGNNTTSTAKVRNITITNSTINLTLNSESITNEVGFLGGASVASIENINIDNTNTINITQKRLGTVKVGGLLGKADNTSTNDINIKDINVSGVINYEIAQDKDAGIITTKNSRATLQVDLGGLIGRASNIVATNVIVGTTINVLDSTLFIVDVANDRVTKDNGNVTINLNVAGLYASSANVNLVEVLYDGVINVNKVSVDTDVAKENFEELNYEYNINLHVAGLLANTLIYNEKLLNVLLVLDNNLEVVIDPLVDLNDVVNTNVFEEVLFTNGRNINYDKDNNKFGVLGTTDNDDIRVFASLDELFAEDSWIINNYNN